MAAAGNSDHWQVGYPGDSASFVAEDVSAGETSNAIEEDTSSCDVKTTTTTTSGGASEKAQVEDKGPTLADVEGAPVEVGVCGLRNLGNTCYMNAGLQSLCAVGSFRETFLASALLPSLPPKAKDIPRPWLHEQLSAHLGSMLRKFWSGYYLSVQPKPLRLILGEVYKPFASSRQQDAQEFLAILLDSLHEFELKKNIPSLSEEGTEPMDTMERREGTMIVTEDSPPVQGPPVQSPPVQGPPVQGPPVQGPPVQGPPVQSPPVQGPPVQGPHVQGPPVQSPSIQHNHPSLSSFVTDTFQGTLKNEVVCTKCSFSSAKREPFMFLSLPIPRALEEQISVVWTTPHSEPQRVMVTVLKHQTFADVKAAVIKCLEIEASPKDVVLFECTSSRISRKLGDEFELRSRDWKAELVGVLLPVEETSGDEEKAESRVIVKWHTCAVCLEEKEDVELMAHPKCNGMLCRPCLKMALEHSPVCAVCQVPVDETKDIVPMAMERETASQTTRLLQVSIMFRREVKTEDNVVMELLGYPMVLNLSIPAPGREIHKMVKEAMPDFLASLPYTLNVTGFMGRYCSRCEFGSKCRGCVIPSCNDPFPLKPGDFIAVTLTASDDVKEKAIAVHNHPSMSGYHSNHVTLEECIEGFSKSELLGNDNPWYCPRCQESRLAERTLAIQAIPNSLIIQLKRFFFHNNFSCKVDTAVDVPIVLEGRVFKDDSTKLLLRSCVCHRGSLSSGHYTAYVHHSNSDKWYYCNDDSITESNASHISSEEVYIMIYEKEGEGESIRTDPLPGMDFTWDNEIGKAVVDWLEPPSSAVVFGPHLPRSSSDTKLNEAGKSTETRLLSFIDDFNLKRESKDVTVTRSTFSDVPLTRRSLTDITGGVVLQSVKVEGVEIYRAKDV